MIGTRADVVAGAGLGARTRAGGARSSRSQPAHAGAAHAVEQVGLVELAAGHEHDVDAVLGDQALEVGERAEVRGTAAAAAAAAVVDEPATASP